MRRSGTSRQTSHGGHKTRLGFEARQSPKSSACGWSKFALTSILGLCLVLGYFQFTIVTHQSRISSIHDGLLRRYGDEIPVQKLRFDVSRSNMHQSKFRRKLVVDAISIDGLYSTAYHSIDYTPRCKLTGICDDLKNEVPESKNECGKDGLSCIRTGKDRRQYIKDAMKNSWSVYKQYAWGHDELAVSAGSSTLRGMDWLGGQGLTIADSLSTLLIMNMTKEYHDAKNWLLENLQPQYQTDDVSVFEVNIRFIGGLLSAFCLSGGSDVMLLEKAQHIAEGLMDAFDTWTGVPQVFTNMGESLRAKATAAAAAEAVEDRGKRSTGRTNLAAAGTYIMELATLSRYTGDLKYAQAADNFWSRLSSLPSCDGLYPTWFDGDIMLCIDDTWDLSLGASADSFYEYMLKQWALTGGKDTVMLERYKAAMAGMRRHLVMEVTPQPSAASGNSHAQHDTTTQDLATSSTSGENVTLGRQQGSDSGKDGSIRNLWDEPFWVVGFGKHRVGLASSCPVSYVKKDTNANSTTPTETANAKTYQEMTQGHNAGNTLPLHDLGNLVSKTRRRLLNLLNTDSNTPSRTQHSVQQGQHPHANDDADGAVSLPSRTARSLLLKTHYDPARHMHADQDVQHSIRTDDDGAFLDAVKHRQQAWFQQHKEHANTQSSSTAAHQDSTSSILSRHSQHSQLNVLEDALHVYDKQAPRRRSWIQGRTRRTSRSYRSSTTPRKAIHYEAVIPERRLQHFTCFVPGMLALGHLLGVDTSLQQGSLSGTDSSSSSSSDGGVRASLARVFGRSKTALDSTPVRPPQARSDDDLLLAGKLMRGCYEMYRRTPTGLAGDVVVWQHPGPWTKEYQEPLYVDTKNYLRPEVVESLFYMWRLTKHQVYRDWGWNIFRAFHANSRHPAGGYCTVQDASTDHPTCTDKQESFWLAETLKYLYLLFSDEPHLVRLDEWVFNTEAHPLPVWGSDVERHILKQAGISAKLLMDRDNVMT